MFVKLSMAIFAFSVMLSGGASTDRRGDLRYSALREKMVLQQLVGRGVDDPGVLKAMKHIPRHLFVSPQDKNRAYGDTALAIGHGQTISQPLIVGMMTQSVRLGADKKKRCLEIGTGSGYQAAVLGELCKEVVTIEIIPPLGKKAGILLAAMGYPNIEARIGDGYRGAPDKAPFDAILITASVESPPQPLLDQLAEGGRMILPLGTPRYARLMTYLKRDGKIETEKGIPVMFVPMTGEAIEKRKEPEKATRFR